MWNSYIQGFSIGMSLIVAIGAQNAFILKQGLLKDHIFWLCFICALSDSILIAAGVFGFSKLVVSYPQAVEMAKYLGAIFLFIYGAQHFYQSFFKSQKFDLSSQESLKDQHYFQRLILVCLAFTWLNPHVYLDTVVLVGSVSTQYESTKLYFLAGAITASWLFFYSLGYGSRFLLPIFQSAKSWKILDALIGIVMWWIAVHLLELSL